MKRGRAWMLAGLLAAAGAVQAQTSNGPAVLPDTLATVVIGDIPGFLDKLGALAARVSPDFKPDQLKKQVGVLMGDPELKALPPGSGLAVILPEQGSPFGFVEVADEKRASWKQQLQERGMTAVDEVQGMLVGGGDEQALKRARELAPKVKEQLLAGRGEPTLAGRVRMARLLEKYDRQIQAGLERMTEAGQSSAVTTETAAQLQAGVTVLRVYRSLASQVESVALTLEPSAEALTLRKHVVFKNGKADASAPAPEPDAARLFGLLPGKGALRGEMNLNSKTMLDFTIIFMEAVDKESGGGGSDEEFREWLRGFEKAWNGAAAMVFIPGEEAPVSGAYAIGVRDADAMLQFLAETPEKFKGSSLERFYERLGMKFQVEFEKNVRQHKGVQIHRLKTSVDFTTGATEHHRRMEEALDRLTYDVALVDKILLYAVEPYRMEDLIEAAQSGSNPDAQLLVSRKQLPSGGWMYFDYYVGQALSASTSLHDPDQPGMQMMKRLGAALKDSPPLLMAGYRAGEGHQFLLRIPVETIKTAVEFAKQVKPDGQKSAPQPDDESTTVAGEKKSDTD